MNLKKKWLESGNKFKNNSLSATNSIYIYVISINTYTPNYQTSTSYKHLQFAYYSFYK